MKTLHSVLAAGTLLLAAVAPAYSAITVYADRAVFNAAVSPTGVDTFEGVAPTGGTSDFSASGFLNGNGLLYNGTRYMGPSNSTPTGDTYLIDRDSPFNTSGHGSDFLWAGYIWPSGGTSSLDIIFPGEVRAFGFDLFTYQSRPLGITLDVTTNVTTYNLAISNNGTTQFHGFSFTPGETLLTARFSASTTAPPDTALLLDDVAVAGGSGEVVIPEPSSLALLGTGVVALFLARRRS